MVSLLTTPVARVRRALGRPSPLRGATVVITGASSGIGEATALAVADRGASVILIARRAAELARVQAAIEARGGVASSYACDLTDLDAVDDVAAKVLAEHGPVDYLVNNAGRSIRRSLALSYDRFHDVERSMAINFLGPVRLTMALLPVMRSQRFGHIVNIVTWGVQLKAPKFSAYIASKSALDAWSRVAARETYRDNVTFTNIRFGLIRTPMSAPTEAYGDHGRSPEWAAAKVVRALEDRPITVDTAVGAVGELAGLLAPRLMDAAFALSDRIFTDSKAARGSR